MFVNYLLFFLGFVFLIKGADFLVDGAASMAKRYGVSPLVIGLTIVSFGTSAPELLVNVVASFQGANDLAIGNILGSNISNTLLILGISAMIYPLTVKHGTVYRQIPFSFFAVVLLGILVNDVFLTGRGDLLLSRLDGVILLVFFILFVYYTFILQKAHGQKINNFEKFNAGLSILMIIGGILGLAIGGKWIVDGGILIAEQIGVSEAFIGLTVVALGTSLPELATSAVAAFKKNSDIAIGNIVGSNIFNILWILGLSAFIKPLRFSTALNIDIFIILMITLVLFLFMFIGKKNILQRWQGFALLSMYVAYIGYLIVRG